MTLLDAALGEVASPLEVVVVVLTLEDCHDELTRNDVADIDGIDAEVVASFGQPLEGFFFGEVKHRLDAQQDEAGRVSLPVVQFPQLVFEARSQALRDATYVLVDDAGVDVHDCAPPPASAGSR
jgi:hypothetical protein